MSDPEEPFCRLAQEAADAEDPLHALRTLAELRVEQLEAVTGQQVRRALRARRSFGDTARVLGISRQPPTAAIEICRARGSRLPAKLGACSASRARRH